MNLTAVDLSFASLTCFLRLINSLTYWMCNYSCSTTLILMRQLTFSSLWPSYVIGQAIIYLPCGFFYLLSFFHA